MVLVLPDRGVWRNFAETQQLGHPQGLDQKSMLEKVVPKLARREAQMRDNPEKGELDPAVDDRKRCRKINSATAPTSHHLIEVVQFLPSPERWVEIVEIFLLGVRPSGFPPPPACLKLLSIVACVL